MGQEFIIKSTTLEDKINQLLPSQGGFQAGVDLSASTTIIPIVDLTESAEGSNIRADLQTALSQNSITSFDISNTTSTIINTTGYFRVFGVYQTVTKSVATNAQITLTDGATPKDIIKYTTAAVSGVQEYPAVPFEFIVFLKAGDSLQGTTDVASTFLRGSTRQIADISGNLVNPT